MDLYLPMRRIAAAAAAAAAAGLAAVSTAAVPAAASTAIPAARYHFRTLDNRHDPSFNQLLDINDKNKIAGYDGSSAPGHPSRGYRLQPPYRQASYQSVNFPRARQTQVFGLNDNKVSVGLFVGQNTPGLTTGFWARNGHYHKVIFPLSMEEAQTRGSHAPVGQPNELLGINNHGVAVGFFTDELGINIGYLFSTSTGKYRDLPLVPSAASATPTGINDHNRVVGYFNATGGPVMSFLLNLGTGHVTTLTVPGADSTQAFGINDKGEVVGTYTVGAATFGFTWTAGGGFRTLSDPHGARSTVVSGVNNAGDLVGSYVASQGGTHGFLATRK